MSFSPEAVQAVDQVGSIIPPSDHYFFTDGQEPPSYVDVWFEGETHIVADGPWPEDSFVDAQLIYSDDEETAEAATAALSSTEDTNALNLELSKDPRTEGEEAVRHMTLATARFMFALANSQE
jgi:hypothetical protein